MLIQNKIVNSFRTYVTRLNKKRVTFDMGSDEFAKYLESVIYTAIRDADLVIPTGAIQVTGSGGPVIQAINVAPILISKGLK